MERFCLKCAEVVLGIGAAIAGMIASAVAQNGFDLSNALACHGTRFVVKSGPVTAAATGIRFCATPAARQFAR